MTLKELFTNIANAIRSKTGSSATIKATDFATQISNIKLATGNATTSQVLSGYTFSNASGNGLTGAMTNRGTWTSTISPGGSVTIPAGYHNGSGKVSANGSASARLSGIKYKSAQGHNVNSLTVSVSGTVICAIANGSYYGTEGGGTPDAYMYDNSGTTLNANNGTYGYINENTSGRGNKTYQLSWFNTSNRSISSVTVNGVWYDGGGEISVWYI